MPLAPLVKKEREVREESLELLDQSDLQEREYVTRMARSDYMNCSLTITYNEFISVIPSRELLVTVVSQVRMVLLVLRLVLCKMAFL